MARLQYEFKFDQPFEIHDDIEILMRMGLAYGLERAECSDADFERAKAMVDPAMGPYLAMLRETGLSDEAVADAARAVPVHSGGSPNMATLAYATPVGIAPAAAGAAAAATLPGPGSLSPLAEVASQALSGAGRK